MSNSLVKLIDAALIPAAVLVVGKIVGLVATVYLFGLPWTIEEIPNSIFAVRPVLLNQDISTGSSYSDLIMYVLIAIGFSVVLVQATHFHDTHIKPNLLIRLSNKNLFGMVKSSFEIYHSAAIWLIFTWIATFVVWIDIASGKTFIWVGAVTIIFSAMLTSILLQDVYKEIELSRKNLGKHHAF